MTTSETTQQAPSAGPPAAGRRLQRSREERVVAGVCGGIARFFDLDATLVRVAAIVSIAFGGFGVLAYVVAVLLIPDEGTAQPLISGGSDRRRGLALLAAATLGVIVLCSFAVLGNVGWWGMDAGWPLALLLAGGALVWFLHERGLPDDGWAAQPAGPSAAPAASGPSASGAPAPDPTADTATATSTAVALREPVAMAAAGVVDDPAAATVADPADAATRPFDSGPPPTGGPPSEPPTAVHPGATPPPEPPRRRGSWVVTLLATGGVLIGLAVAAALDATGAVDLGWGAFAAITVILTGVALVASAFFGGARGLIPVGLLLALALGTTAAAGVSLEGGIGEEEHRVTTAAQLDDRYELAVGRLALDLRGLDLPPGETRISADLDVGQLAIYASDAELAGGEIDIHGDGDQESSGVDVDREITFDAGDGRLVIDAHVGIGVILVSERPDGDSWSDATPPPLVVPVAAPAAPRCAPVGFALAPACNGGGDDAA